MGKKIGWLLRTHALAITCERDSYYVRTRSVLRAHAIAVTCTRSNGLMKNGISVNGIALVSYHVRT